jgi:hypothetical protein
MRRDVNASGLTNGAVGTGIGIKTLELFDREPRPGDGWPEPDRLDVECPHFTPSPELLFADSDEPPVQGNPDQHC